MKRLTLMGLAALFGLLLGACGLVPPVSVTDPLKLDGEALEVTAGQAAGISPQQVPASGGTAEPKQFADQDLGIPVNPSSLTVNGGLSSNVTVIAGAYPDSLELSDIDLTVRLWDGPDAFDAAPADRRVETEASWTGTLSLSRTDECTVPQEPCTYSFDDAELASASLRVQLSGNDLSTLLAVIQESPQPNYVEATVTMTVAGSGFDLSAGDRLIFELNMADGEVRVL